MTNNARSKAKMGMTRWFAGFVTTVQAFFRIWHSELVISLYVCLQFGMFKQGKATDLISLSTGNATGDEIEKSTTKEDGG